MSDYSVLTAALDLACARCGSAPGQSCRTSSGRVARWPHGARTEPLAYAYGAGYDEGHRDGIARARRTAAGEQR